MAIAWLCSAELVTELHDAIIQIARHFEDDTAEVFAILMFNNLPRVYPWMLCRGSIQTTHYSLTFVITRHTFTLL